MLAVKPDGFEVLANIVRVEHAKTILAGDDSP
jgi:hypothetical protein